MIGIRTTTNVNDIDRRRGSPSTGGDQLQKPSLQELQHQSTLKARLRQSFQARLLFRTPSFQPRATTSGVRFDHRLQDRPSFEHRDHRESDWDVNSRTAPPNASQSDGQRKRNNTDREVSSGLADDHRQRASGHGTAGHQDSKEIKSGLEHHDGLSREHALRRSQSEDRGASAQLPPKIAPLLQSTSPPKKTTRVRSPDPTRLRPKARRRFQTPL